jgi:hypothetical protein
MAMIYPHLRPIRIEIEFGLHSHRPHLVRSLAPYSGTILADLI